MNCQGLLQDCNCDLVAAFCSHKTAQCILRKLGTFLEKWCLCGQDLYGAASPWVALQAARELVFPIVSCSQPVPIGSKGFVFLQLCLEEQEVAEVQSVVSTHKKWSERCWPNCSEQQQLPLSLCFTPFFLFANICYPSWFSPSAKKTWRTLKQRCRDASSSRKA